ncbi:hypothetical protein RUM44_005833 [Polyplax serrata]|uniref:Xylulose kinase n=1 Tax=Polyplax serrata TaxID=468196 RepID=A0ABR1AZP8_POLSC
MADLSSRDVEKANFAFSIYDLDGSGTVDAFYLGDVLRGLNLNPTNATIEKLGGTKKKGEKTMKIDEFLPIFSQCKKDKDHGGFEDFLECLKLYDKQENGMMLGAELSHTLLALGERLTDAECEEVMKDCSPPEDDEGFIAYEVSAKVSIRTMTNYLGLDFSTQKLKAVVVDSNLTVIHESAVVFDRQLPEFRTQGGVVKGEKGAITVPVTLWIKAVDLLFDQMKLDGVDFSVIKALSGAAQQHGSVYWQSNGKAKLKNLDSSQFLFQQLQGCFSLKESPVWMDSSTSTYCLLMEDSVGGAEKMAEITGSRAFERFTGSQIAKFADQRPSTYDLTERISLISSFACSLFVGDYAAIDYADASGMNLMDIRKKKWDPACVKATKAPNLEEKLGSPMPPLTNFGNISKYFVDRFGFNPSCQIVIFTGDNPATLAGMQLSEKDLAVSLGTSDTVMMSLSEPVTTLNGHVMCKSTERNGWLGLLCFKNGSLTRERLRNLYAQGSWDEFNRLLDSTPRGNFGNFGLYFDNTEILPFLKKGDYRWNSKGEKVVKFAAPEMEVRALIEGQFLARRAFVEEMGFIHSDECRILATGGASLNKVILQVLCDVFNIPVYIQKCNNSAAFGSAYRAKLGMKGERSPEAYFEDPLESELVCAPNKDAVQIYDPMLKKYKMFVSALLKAE